MYSNFPSYFWFALFAKLDLKNRILKKNPQEIVILNWIHMKNWASDDFAHATLKKKINYYDHRFSCIDE